MDENRTDVQRVVEQADVLRRAADLDLLIFFARHPRSLLTSEQIATFLGYEVTQIAESLELLLTAGILTRTQNPTHAARLYVFSPSLDPGGWLPALLRIAASRDGRLSLLAELSNRRSRGPGDHAAGSARTATRDSRARPVLVRGVPGTAPTSKTG
jgi:hypothetical protein